MNERKSTFLEARRLRIEQELEELRPVMAQIRRLERELAGVRAAEEGTKRNLSLEVRQDQVKDLIRAKSQMDRLEVAEALGLTRARAGQIIAALVSGGDILDEEGQLRLNENPLGLYSTDEVIFFKPEDEKGKSWPR
jgi:hypothetical protein